MMDAAKKEKEMNLDHTYIDVYASFSIRTANCIRNNTDEDLYVTKEKYKDDPTFIDLHFYNVASIKNKGRKWWLSQKNFGAKCLAELESVVGKMDD